MITLQVTTAAERIKNIFNIQINPAHIYIAIMYREEDIGLFEIQMLSKITGNLHMHIKENFQNKKFGFAAVNKLLTELKDSNIQQMVAMVPSRNKAIQRLTEKTKTKCCGILKDAIIWNGELDDLLLFQLEVK